MIFNYFRNMIWNTPFLANTIGYLFYKFAHFYELKKAKENKRYKNIHSGERCFILGNGPSLKDIDMGVLQNEYVFTVNQFCRHPDFKSVKSNYHFWVDSNFFCIDENKPEDIELLDTMIHICDTNPDLECFYPAEQIAFVKKYGIDKKTNSNYFISKGYVSNQKQLNTDYSRFCSACGTVVQWAINAAIYMGFHEIYLLGCDNTGIMVSIKSLLKDNDSHDYAYELTDNEKHRMENMLTRNGLEEYVKGYLKIITSYKALNKYCEMHNIKLINCSSQTVIDSIPREKFENIRI